MYKNTLQFLLCYLLALTQVFPEFLTNSASSIHIKVFLPIQFKSYSIGSHSNHSWLTLCASLTSRCNIFVCPDVSVHMRYVHKWASCLSTPLSCTMHHIACTKQPKWRTGIGQANCICLRWGSRILYKWECYTGTTEQVSGYSLMCHSFPVLSDRQLIWQNYHNTCCFV